MITCLRDLASLSGQHIVYALQWGGGTYIGSSINIAARIGWWKTKLRALGVTSAVLKIVLEANTEIARFSAEATLIQNLRTFGLGGHNKTHDGKPGLRGLKPNNKKGSASKNFGKPRPVHVRGAVAEANRQRRTKQQDTVRRFAFNYGVL